MKNKNIKIHKKIWNSFHLTIREEVYTAHSDRYFPVYNSIHANLNRLTFKPVLKGNLSERTSIILKWSDAGLFTT